MATPSSTSTDPSLLGKRRVPLDLEAEIKRKNEAEANWKPKFIPKKERERLAADKAARDEEEKREKLLQAKQDVAAKRREANGNAAAPVDRAPTDRPRHAHQSSSIPTGPKSMRGQQQHGGDRRYGGDREGDRGNRDRDRDHRDRDRDRDRDRGGQQQGEICYALGRRVTEQEIQEDYARQSLFGEKSKFEPVRKKRRVRDKFKFDWDPSEDTSRAWDPTVARPGQTKGTSAGGKQQPPARVKGGQDEDEFVSSRSVVKVAYDPHALGRNGYGSKKEAFDPPRHWAEKSLEEMKDSDWRNFYEEFDISVKPRDIATPLRYWKELDLRRQFLDIIDSLGYTDPTPVQRAAIPIALLGHDLIGVAKTGSGKTVSFLLPLFAYISERPRFTAENKLDGPYGLILAPTRELALQIEIEATKFATPLGFKCASIVGGHSVEAQALALQQGAELIVATPGRLVDCIERHVLVLRQCHYIVMDEADRMVDMGFEIQLKQILDQLPQSTQKPANYQAENKAAVQRLKRAREAEASPFENGNRDSYDRVYDDAPPAPPATGLALHPYRQTVMYTATMPAAVERIARTYLQQPAIVTIGDPTAAVQTVEQRVEFVRGEDRRMQRLDEILASPEFAAPIIVFVSTKVLCDNLYRRLKGRGVSCVSLHSRKTQQEREKAVEMLRDGSADVLVATDLAGRGLDVPDVTLVVNFNMPSSIDTYTHRIGRTGRAGKRGIAISFLDDGDSAVMYDLRKMLEKSGVSRVPDELRKHPSSKASGTDLWIE